jgi:uncharacterized protein with PIN domain
MGWKIGNCFWRGKDWREIERKMQKMFDFGEEIDSS